MNKLKYFWNMSFFNKLRHFITVTLISWHQSSLFTSSLFTFLYIISYTYSWQHIWAHIHGLCSYYLTQGGNRGVICAQAVYMSQFTLSRICITTFIILQDFLFCENYVIFTVLSGIWYYLQVIANYPWGAPLSTRTPKTRALTGSTFGIYSWFRSGMETKQKPVDSF